MRRALLPLVAALVLTATAGCGSDDEPTADADTPPASIAVSSNDLTDGGTVPADFTCDGDEVSPQLAWDAVPDDAAVLALVVDDPDAPSGTFTHWVVLDIPTTTSATNRGEVPAGGTVGLNSAGEASYAGMCPPDGSHDYRFTVFALDAPTGLESGASVEDAMAAVNEHVVAFGRITASYSRSTS